MDTTFLSDVQFFYRNQKKFTAMHSKNKYTVSIKTVQKERIGIYE